jgi:hypothetical protein
MAGAVTTTLDNDDFHGTTRVVVEGSLVTEETTIAITLVIRWTPLFILPRPKVVVIVPTFVRDIVASR